MFTSGAPQMRQSDGNKTAKRLSAIWRVQRRPVREAIEGPATAALTWLARILSPVLLKTASVLPAGNLSWAGDSSIACLHSSITAAGSARQRCGRLAVPRLPFSRPLRAAALSRTRTPNDSPAGSILRSAPAAEERSAEDNAQKTSGAANGSLFRRRNRRSGIQGIAGTTLDRGSSLTRYTSE
jgi:hypothetical protein